MNYSSKPHLGLHAHSQTHLMGQESMRAHECKASYVFTDAVEINLFEFNISAILALAAQLLMCAGHQTSMVPSKEHQVLNCHLTLEWIMAFADASEVRATFRFPPRRGNSGAGMDGDLEIGTRISQHASSPGIPYSCSCPWYKLSPFMCPDIYSHVVS